MIINLYQEITISINLMIFLMEMSSQKRKIQVLVKINQYLNLKRVTIPLTHSLINHQQI